MSITEQQAFEAMYAFLNEFYERTKSQEVGALLGSMSLLPDGKTADPTVWSDWQRCVRQAKRGEVQSRLELS
jgi:ribosomal protein L1